MIWEQIPRHAKLPVFRRSDTNTPKRIKAGASLPVAHTRSAVHSSALRTRLGLTFLMQVGRHLESQKVVMLSALK